MVRETPNVSVTRQSWQWSNRLQDRAKPSNLELSRPTDIARQSSASALLDKTSFSLTTATRSTSVYYGLFDTASKGACPALCSKSPRWPTKVTTAVLVVFIISGCQRQRPQVVDPDRATATLRDVLDAWTSGAARESLLTASPPIHVADAEWIRGRKLLEYKVESGSSEVLLTVQTEDGMREQHAASYRIDTEPSLVVVHEEWGLFDED